MIVDALYPSRSALLRRGKVDELDIGCEMYEIDLFSMSIQMLVGYRSRGRNLLIFQAKLIVMLIKPIWLSVEIYYSKTYNGIEDNLKSYM